MHEMNFQSSVSARDFHFCIFRPERDSTLIMTFTIVFFEQLIFYF